MKSSLKYLFVLFLVMLFASCDQQKKTGQEKEIAKKEYTPISIVPDSLVDIILNDSIREMIKKQGKRLAYTSQIALKGELQAAIKRDGLPYAISFCNDRAMEIMDSISLENNVMISRIAKKNRNPLNAMDENESNLYKSYVMHYISGGPPYPTVGWNEAGNPVYYYPIHVDALCLNCHGTIGNEVMPEVAERIAELYPEDLAVDFRQGDPRGLWRITFPTYRITGVD
jgi:hypothetical protein